MRKPTCLKLLSELDFICQKSNVSYCLCEQTALMIYKNLDISEKQMGQSILLCASDFYKLKEYIDKNPIKERALEFLGNNPNYPDWSARYVDISTLHFSFADYDNYKNKGIGITIYLLLDCPSSVIKSKLITVIQTGWELNREHRAIIMKPKHYLCKWAVKSIKLLIGKKNAARILFDLVILHLAQDSNADCYMIKKFMTSRKFYKKQIIMPVCLQKFKNDSFYLPNNIFKYLEITYGKNWSIKAEIQNDMETGVLFDEEISFCFYENELKKQGIDLNAIMKMHYKTKHYQAKRLKYFKLKLQYWNKAWYVNQYLSAKKKYSNEKEYILNAYKNKDYDALQSSLDFYDEVMKGLIKHHIYKTIDPELEIIYFELLEIQGSKNKKFLV